MAANVEQERRERHIFRLVAAAMMVSAWALGLLNLSGVIRI